MKGFGDKRGLKGIRGGGGPRIYQETAYFTGFLP
jgi:hypothetical protein